MATRSGRRIKPARRQSMYSNDESWSQFQEQWGKITDCEPDTKGSSPYYLASWKPLSTSKFHTLRFVIMAATVFPFVKIRLLLCGISPLSFRCKEFHSPWMICQLVIIIAKLFAKATSFQFVELTIFSPSNVKHLTELTEPLVRPRNMFIAFIVKYTYQTHNT